MRLQVVKAMLNFAAVATAFIVMIGAGPAAAQVLRVSDAATFSNVTPTQKSPVATLSISNVDALAVGYLTPAYGAVSLGLPTGGRAFSGAGSGLGIGTAFDLTSDFQTRIYGTDVGVFGGFAGQPSILSLTPTTSWNFGASVGYAGFYVRGSVSDAQQSGLFVRTQGWQAGFGYETGALDLRLTYAITQSAPGLRAIERELDSQQWTIGGIYKISPRLRLNADAFYGIHENRGALLSLVPAATALQAPQGTGARVGIQLRF